MRSCLSATLFFLFFFLVDSLTAQIIADFTLSKSAGCSPLVVSFTSNTRGASPDASYEWSFGNGNSSKLEEPKAVYTEVGIYTVTLIVRDGSQTSSQSKQVTVYKNPEVNFSNSKNKGCLPLPVEFMADAKPGDGSISSYTWDFGDGNTTTATASDVTHMYRDEGLASASLTVTNSFGCYTTIEKKNIVNVLPVLKPNFKPDVNFLCKIDDPVRLTNLSTGPGQLTYSWDFGDANTSTDKDPTHIFNKQGLFTVKLTVNSSEGCLATETKTNVLNVGNFKTDFSIPQVICQNAFYSFKNLSSPVSDSYTWFVDGMQIYWQPRDALGYGFNTPGKHKIRLENKFGTCINAVEKEIEVRAPLKLEGFVAELKDRCSYPAQYILKDTTAGAVGWTWNSTGTVSDKKEIVASYYYDGPNWVSLKVKDSAGCIAEITKPVEVKMPTANLRAKGWNHYEDVLVCRKGEVNFYVETGEKITSYEWDFPGTGLTSTLAEPNIAYDKPGTYQATVALKTEDGCSIKINSRFNIVVENPIIADFSADDQTICGDTPVRFTAKLTVPPFTSEQSILYTIQFGDGFYATSGLYSNELVHRYMDSGIYTVKMIVRSRTCSDTITKLNYIQVLPAFPRIFSVNNTCDGDRGTVSINYEAKHALSGTWDFGDGTTAPLDMGVNTVSHHYNKTGRYKIILSVTNGNCTNKDSVTAAVFKKQSPIVSSEKPFACRNMEEIKMQVYNFDPVTGIWPGAFLWPEKVEDNNGRNLDPTMWRNGQTDSSFGFIAQNFRLNGGDSIRLILTASNFQCRDTTNWIAFKVSGPQAAARFEVPCGTENTVNFYDISTSTDKIVLREWIFGDNITLVTSDPGPIKHIYPNSWGYNVKFSVIDEKGCNSWTYINAGAGSRPVIASFSASSTLVSPGSNVNFTNTSLSSQPGTSYTWLFGDGTSSSQKDDSKTYTQPGSYTVKLIAYNSIVNCADTATQTIVVKFLNAAFNINKSFITASKCPPVSVQFNNTSSNISKILWDFGDGSTSTVFNPSHIYTKSGIYVVTMKGYGDNGTEYRTVDTVKILAPLAQISADSLTGCANQQTNFKATAENALNYTWDFGDGTVLTSSDSMANYNYRNSGVFRPKLIVTDINGCSVASDLKDSVVIDSLSLKLSGLPTQICVPRAVEFNSIAATAVAGQRLDYQWKFGTANGDGSDLAKPTFNYNQTGKYMVQLTVRTSFGCVGTVNQEVIANQGLGAILNGPSEICEGSEASFTASTSIQGSPKWTWIFPGGNSSSLQNPAPLTLQQAGDYQVKLIADNAGCTDTLTKSLTVNAKPASILAVKSLQICAGAPANLSAQGGASYKWTPVASLTLDTGANVTARPQQNTTYTVSVTNDKGCVAKDSVNVGVVQKQKLSLAPEISICSGSSAKLSASGTDKYTWIGNTSGLSSSNIAEPTASPASNMKYRVMGSDAAGCFSDTAAVDVIVNASPTVDAGVGAEISVGDSYQLKPTTSLDVTKYLWSPDRTLSCVTCQSPLASPLESVTYTLKVTNANGCVAADTVTVEVMCTESKIYIPNVFTPNGDGKNDLFSIKGAGIKVVKSFRIFDRWGKMIFEKNNFAINDPSAAWNGRVNGVPVPVGSYIYMAELSCDGKTFTRKGTISVIY